MDNMGLWSKIKSLVTPDEEWDDPTDEELKPPTARAEALDVEFNPRPASRVDRKLGRLLTLYRTRDVTQEVHDEILRYRGDLERMGYAGLNDEDAVLELIETLRG
jgi:hypothetical protein